MSNKLFGLFERPAWILVVIMTVLGIATSTPVLYWGGTGLALGYLWGRDDA